MAHRPLQTTAPSGPSRSETIALILSIGWMVAIGAFFLIVPPGGEVGFDSLRFVLTLIAVFLPVAMIWVAAAAARSARLMRDEAQALHGAIDRLRQNLIAERQGRPLGVPVPDAAQTVERKLADIAQAGGKVEQGMATFTSSRDRRAAEADAAASPPVDPQASLGFDTQHDAPPMVMTDLIRAMNFPDTETDTEGFRALRKALKDPRTKPMIQASQDLLTLLSQDGIYMDDLQPDRPRPELWRQFAAGERGRAMGSLGGVRDRTSLALTSGRMRADPIFRDAAHHFLRHFDRVLITVEPEATDTDLVAMSDTRTARAFMLIGRVTGAFD